MSGWLKALLIIVVVVVLLAVGAVVAGVYWLSRNKDTLIARGRDVFVEGQQFGRSTDNHGCVNESVSRYKKEPGFGTTISNGIFIRACLQSSQPTPGFCDDVPKQTDFIKSAQWIMSRCRQVDLENDSNCQGLFSPVQQFCEEKDSRSANYRTSE
jgi:hypothetical protein